MRVKTVLFVILSLAGSYLAGQNGNERKSYTTHRVEGSAPVIDGSLDDRAWEQGNWEGGFVQYEPYENVAPTCETRFKILYDDNNLYVAIQAFDPAPDSIVRRLSRRDDGQGDMAGVQFDSYFDRRTGFTFMISAAGVKEDIIYLDDGQSQDATWDPVWYAKTTITAEGWNAEMQIPLTQLRFGKQERYVWGLQVARVLYRKQETSLWQPIPRNASGWVHLIGEMDGINNINPKKQVDITPYTVGQAEYYEKEPGNPFRTGRSQELNAGLDAKIGLSNDLTLDLSVNPDFGQVEADPSVVNLTAFETFFTEKRPFFVEGRGIMNYRLQPGDGDGAMESLFYSRRIGRQPQYYPDRDGNCYIQSPSNTTILGAAKLTGKTRNGLSVGIMESFTARENAVIDSEGIREKTQVEPFTNYFSARVSQDYDKGNTVVGGMVTAVNRDLTQSDLLFLHRSAYSGGVDFEHNWKEKTYTFRAKLLFSHVAGDSIALIRTQRSSARYFHRPDAGHLSLDSARTSLPGHGGSMEFWKGGNTKLQFGGFVLWKSPGLELNDIGYVRNVDEVLQVAWIGYRQFEPKWIFRYWGINANQWTSYDFSGLLTYKGGNVNGYMQFRNYWSFSAGVNMQGASLSKALLRGGPLFHVPGTISSWGNVQSDNRKLLSVYFGWYLMNAFHGHSSTRNYWGGLTYRPAPAVSLSLSPEYTLYTNNLQYVENLNTSYGPRYVSASLDQKSVSLSLRANLNISPDLTIQYWGQPFISSGSYTNFKYVTDPRAGKYKDRFQTYYAEQIAYNTTDEAYEVDEDLNGTVDYSFENPNFKALFFQSNLVLRWEYLPGSALFLVWSQGRSDYFLNGGFSLSDDTHSLYRIHPHNVFLIKISYRFGLS